MSLWKQLLGTTTFCNCFYSSKVLKHFYAIDSLSLADAFLKRRFHNVYMLDLAGM
jgi:hypothetical protein